MFICENVRPLQIAKKISIREREREREKIIHESNSSDGTDRREEEEEEEDKPLRFRCDKGWSRKRRERERWEEDEVGHDCASERYIRLPSGWHVSGMFIAHMRVSSDPLGFGVFGQGPVLLNP